MRDEYDFSDSVKNPYIEKAIMGNNQYVGFWNRFHAVIVMAIFLTILEMGISYVVFDDIFMSDIEFLSIEDILINHIFPLIVTIIIWIKFSSDFGKMLYRAKIVDASTYQKPTTKQFIIRYLGYYLSLLPLGLGYFWVIWDTKKQAWHDKLAHTIVIKPQKEKEQLKWYMVIYRSILSIFVFLMMIGAIMAYIVPEDNVLIKANSVTNKEIKQLIDNQFIKEKKELFYYHKTHYVFDEVDTSIVSITSDGICVMNLKDLNAMSKGCFKYKDIGQLQLDYDDNIVYLYDASVYSADYRESDEYYNDDNSTQNALYLSMIIDEKDKLEFNKTVMNLWKKYK